MSRITTTQLVQLISTLSALGIEIVDDGAPVIPTPKAPTLVAPNGAPLAPAVPPAAKPVAPVAPTAGRSQVKVNSPRFRAVGTVPAPVQPAARVATPAKPAKPAAGQPDEYLAGQYRSQVWASEQFGACPWCARHGVLSEYVDYDAVTDVKSRLRFGNCEHTVNFWWPAAK
jgi:hypothetical protein